MEVGPNQQHVVNCGLVEVLVVHIFLMPEEREEQHECNPHGV